MADETKPKIGTIVVDLIIVGLLSVTTFVVASRYDLLERVIAWLQQYEVWDLDEIVILAGVLTLALAVFSLRRWADVRREMARRLVSEAAERQNLSRLEILHTIDRAILAAHSCQEIAAAALDALRDLLGADLRANVILSEQNSEESTVLASSVPDDPLLPVGTHVTLAEIYELGVLSKKGVVYLDDAAIKSSTLALVEQLREGGIRSVMMVPIVLQDQIAGTLNLGSSSPGAFRPEYEGITIEVAEALALAIHQARLSEEIAHSREQLSRLSRRLMETQEAERRRIARELHDQIGQSLVAIKLQLQSMSGLSDRDQRVVRLRESIAVVERTIRQVRDLSFDLRPSVLDDLGLIATLRWYVNRQSAWAGITAQFASDPPEMDLPSEIEVAAFRIAQEALTNALHHAQAKEVCVTLWKRDEELVLRVLDDGLGFDKGAMLRGDVGGQSLGLLGMRERAHLAGGQLEIESAPGQGTMVQVRLPLPGAASGDGAGPRPEGRQP
jgi:signal transduction histidine kinase